MICPICKKDLGIASGCKEQDHTFTIILNKEELRFYTLIDSEFFGVYFGVKNKTTRVVNRLTHITFNFLAPIPSSLQELKSTIEKLLLLQ